MLFKNLNNNIEFEKYPEDEEKITLHVMLPRTTRENLNELKAVYDESGIDKHKFTFQVFIGMLVDEYIEGITDDIEGLLRVMSKMKIYQRKCKS